MSPFTRCCSLVAVVFACSFSVASAYGPWYGAPGAYGGGGYGAYGGAYGGYGAYGAGYGGVGGGGGIATGMANLVGAQGQRNVENSQAAINYQEANIEHQKAVSAELDNFQKLRSNRDQLKAKTKASDAARQQADREAEARRQKFEADHRPPPLAGNQLDPLTGKIEWPSALQDFDFFDTRRAVDALFKTRAESGPTDDLAAQMQTEIHKLQNQLRAHIQKIPLPEYSVSRKFLDRLINSIN